MFIQNICLLFVIVVRFDLAINVAEAHNWAQGLHCRTHEADSMSHEDISFLQQWLLTNFLLFLLPKNAKMQKANSMSPECISVLECSSLCFKHSAWMAPGTGNFNCEFEQPTQTTHTHTPTHPRPTRRAHGVVVFLMQKAFG